MTGILVSVLTPVVLIGYWALIVTTARNNEVISPLGRLTIKVRGLAFVLTADTSRFMQDLSASFASLVPVARRVSEQMQELRVPLAKLEIEMRDDGGDEE